MSHIKFVEAFSTDPFVREIHQKVVNALNNPKLDRHQRETHIRQLQNLLIEHQAKESRKAAQLIEEQASKGKATQMKRNAGVADPSQILARRREFEGETNARTVRQIIFR